MEKQMILDFVDAKIESLEDYLDNLRPEEESLRGAPEHDLIMFKKIEEILESAINDYGMIKNIKYHSYNSYDDIEIWYGDRDKGKFIIGTRSEKEADKVVNELNTLLSENIRLEKENKELKQTIESLKMEIAELRESEKDNYNVTDGLYGDV